ncbi:MAG: hypothetical protein NTY74_13845 [Ignavibacteriae bacterium]|nr:hypothetical protein [Ignavibacteriota bacterium]
MEIDFDKIKSHRQLTEISCIPMAVESILILLDYMKVNDTSLQSNPAYSGNSNWIKSGWSISKGSSRVVFKREFHLPDLNLKARGDHFMVDYFDKLFEKIDDELNNERLVIISLESGTDQWHMEVIFDKVNNDEYKTFTFYHNHNGPKINESNNLRERVTSMKGTDILTYLLIEE